MKKLLFSLVVFSVLLIVGCQENSITNPVQDPENATKTLDSPVSGTIMLQRSLENPYPAFNSFFNITGAIDYVISVNYLDPIPPNSQEVISLQLSINAELSNVCSACAPAGNELPAGVITGETTDIINITNDGLHSVNKTYVIQKRDDGMVLKCSFSVTTGGITLDDIWLALPITKVAQDDNTL